MAINFLPEAEKEQVKFLKTRKIMFIFGSLLIIFFLVFAFALYLLDRYLISEIEIQKNLVAQRQNEVKKSEFQELKTKTIELNQNLVRVQALLQKELRFSPVLIKIASLVPQELYLKRLSLKKNKATEKEQEPLGVLTLSGFASTRETLFFFKKSLEAEEGFSEVWFSLESWLKPTDIEFYSSSQFKF